MTSDYLQWPGGAGNRLGRATTAVGAQGPLRVGGLRRYTGPHPVNSLDPFDSAHAGVLALVGTRTPEQAAQHIQRGLP